MLFLILREIAFISLSCNTVFPAGLFMLLIELSQFLSLSLLNASVEHVYHSYRTKKNSFQCPVGPQDNRREEEATSF